MISVDMLQNMKPEDVARVCDILGSNMTPEDVARVCDILGYFACVSPATPCMWCPYAEACKFIDVLYHELKARSKP